MNGFYCPGDDRAGQFDKQIDPLVQALWDVGILACKPYQEIESGVITIEFPSFEDAEEFLTKILISLTWLATKHLPEAEDWLFNRIMGYAGEKRAAWKYKAHPCLLPDDDSTEALENSLHHEGVMLMISVRFPAEDYLKVVELLDGYVYEEGSRSLPGSESLW